MSDSEGERKEPTDQIAKLAGPVGGLWVAYNDFGICGSGFANLTTFARFREELHDRTGRPARLAEALPDELYDLVEESFATGDRDKLTFDLRGASPFQKSVWEACLTIPAGETRSYSDLAADIHRPKAVRAVGAALGTNPIPVLVRGLRVLRSDGTLGGYAYGLPIKERLLDREAVRSAA